MFPGISRARSRIGPGSLATVSIKVRFLAGSSLSSPLVQIDDDRRYFPPYEAVPLVRAETLDRFPQLREVLNRVAGKIDALTMRELNRAVDEHRENPEDVARGFLKQAGLLARE